jgi:DNA-binding transcriptional ArsR family regulator
MMAYTVVSVVGEDMGSLYSGVREFPTKRAILLCSEDKLHLAEKAKKDLDKFKIPVLIKKLNEDTWEGIFEAIKDIKELEGDKELIINAASGENGANKCAICSAAFVNGLKAFTVTGDDVMLMPIMKFSYYKLLTEKKMDIVRFLFKNTTCCSSLEDLSRKLGLSLPLLSYHINGNLKSEGLKEMGLVTTEENKGRTSVKLTLLGRLLAKGYVS